MKLKARLTTHACLALLLLLAAVWLGAGAATAEASGDLAIKQSASSTKVEKGDKVTITVTVKNDSSEVVPAGTGVEMAGLGAGEKVSKNPYLSVSPSQGSCTRVNGSKSIEFCPVGELAPGAKMHITAVVRMEETMTHNVGFAFVGENGQPSTTTYHDSVFNNDIGILKIAATTRPILTGSPKIHLPGLPTSCVKGNLKLQAVVAAPKVQEVAASLEGWRQASQGSNQLRATVPVPRNHHPSPYKLKIKARLQGGTQLERVVEFQPC